MQTQLLRQRARSFTVAVALLVLSGWAGAADPPSRVARLGYTSGAVSFSPAGESDWVQAAVNRPLTTGDRLWTDTRARAELQVGGAMIRLDASTGISVLNLDDSIAQLQLTQGTLNVRVRRLGSGQVFEVDTPNLAFSLREPGEYRIEVDADGQSTTIVMRQGQGEAYGEDASYVIDTRQPYRFYGTGLREYDQVDAPPADDFDRWAGERDHSYDNSRSARYVSPDVIGYQDLDANGTWRVDASYGNVWTPNRVAAGWAPYQDGHWAWVDPWGWTWVDDAPWGFAVSHYGRWASFGGTWGWVPGPARTPAYYAPALVVFVGGANFQLAISSGNVGGVAWFPLGPREVYRPSYRVSRGYFENINRSNTVINTTVINNYYTNTNVTNIVYVNRQVPGAIVAVPTTTFVQSQPVSRAVVRVRGETFASAPVAIAAPVVPTERSVHGAAAKGDKPPARVFERSVVARTEPPARPVGFAAQQPHLAANPGQPIDDAARKGLKPATAAPVPVVKMVAPEQAARPTALPPRNAAAGRGDEGRGKAEDRKAQPMPAGPPAPAAPPQATPPTPEQPGKAGQGGKEDRRTPALPPQVAAPPQPAPAALPAQPAEQKGRSGERGGQGAGPTRGAPPQAAPPEPPTQPAEPRGKSDQRGSGAVPIQGAPPQAAQPAPSTQPAEPRGKPDQRGNSGEARGQAATPPPQRPAPPAVAAPAPEPPPVQRGNPEQRGGGQARGQAATPPPQQRQAPPAVAAPAPELPPAQRGKPEPGPAPRQAEPQPAAKAPTPEPPKPAPASQAEPRGKGGKSAPGKPDDKKGDGDDPSLDPKQRQKKE